MTIILPKKADRMTDMNMKEYIEEAERDLLHTYNRYQIVLDKGEGVHLYDMRERNTLISLPAFPYLHSATETRSITMLLKPRSTR